MMRHKMNRIQSKWYKIGDYDVKFFSSCFDDKRYILGDGNNNLAYFHKDIRSQKLGINQKYICWGKEDKTFLLCCY